MSNVKGYIGVLIPKYNYFQGCFLYEEQRPLGDMALANIKRVLPPDASETRTPAPGIDPKDQGYLGGLCAGLIEMARTERQDGMASFGWAISILSGCRYFIVKGDIDGAGTATTFERMPVLIHTPDAARDYLNNHREVSAIKARLVDEAMQKAKGKPQ